MRVEINGQNYEAMKMTPRESFHCMRRLTPLLAACVGPLMGLLDDEKPKDEAMAEIASAIGPLTEVLSTLPDDQLDYVLDKSLLHLKRLDRDSGNWFDVYVAQPKGLRPLLMFKDVDPMTELRLVAEVMKTNLSGFFAALSVDAASFKASGLESLTGK